MNGMSELINNSKYTTPLFCCVKVVSLHKAHTSIHQSTSVIEKTAASQHAQYHEYSN